MSTFKTGQVVKFLKPYPGEDSEQPYIVVEFKDGHEETRINISPMMTGLDIPPVYTVRTSELAILDLSAAGIND